MIKIKGLAVRDHPRLPRRVPYGHGGRQRGDVASEAEMRVTGGRSHKPRKGSSSYSPGKARKPLSGASGRRAAPVLSGKFAVVGRSWRCGPDGLSC